MTNTLVVEVSDGVMTLTINRPEKRNAIDRGALQPSLERTSSVEPAISGLPQSSTSLMSGSIMRIPIFRSSTRRPEELNPNASLSFTSEAMPKGRPGGLRAR